MPKITLQQLESHLWESANILRGSIDAADYKHYIFGLLFYKRLCDVWEEEFEERLAVYGDKEMAADPDEHRFDIPSGHFWKDVRKHATNIGELLNQAFQAIEDANTRLRGVFQDVDFNNKERFPDAMLERLLQHFETYRLRNADVEADILGNAYEYLIKQFADDSGKKGGEFYTPKQVVRMMVACLQPKPGMSIYDPTCGSGGMLLTAHQYVKEHGQDPKSLSLYGQEKNLNTWAICQMNLFLHDIDDAFVERADTLLNPMHLVGDGTKALRTFDRVLANPPFSLKSWGYDIWSNGDPFGRDTYGCPPKGYGDLAFVQHMIASLKDDGLMAVVLPHGVLFRGGAEGRIREGLLKADLIDAVIGVAPNLFYGAGIPACIMLVRKTKPEGHTGKVLIVNGAKQFVPGKNQNQLSDANVETLSRAYLDYQDKDQLARVVPMDEIQANDWNVNITRYVHIGEDEEEVDVAAEVEKLVALQAERDEAETRMMRFLEELGYVN
ncbi:N-6 DNA methylase [Thalassobaculum sp.]|uniref:type I restriction-modification system subunit M n=1 Tax=Thalassobaculum sp. TaxID=2022740 RepID=UPI003B5B5E9B